LGILKDPEEIFPPYFFYVLIGVSPADQLLGNVYHLASIAATLHAATPVEIGAYAHVVNPRHLHYMIDMVNHIGNGCQFGGELLLQGVPIDVELFLLLGR
jgi:hypothetical protein